MAKDNVTNIRDYAEDNRYDTPQEVCAELATDLENPECPHHGANKALVLLLNTKDESWELGYRAANLSTSEMIAMLETAKVMCLQQMNYIPGDDYEV